MSPISGTVSTSFSSPRLHRKSCTAAWVRNGKVSCRLWQMKCNRTLAGECTIGRSPQQIFISTFRILPFVHFRFRCRCFAIKGRSSIIHTLTHLCQLHELISVQCHCHPFLHPSPENLTKPKRSAGTSNNANTSLIHPEETNNKPRYNKHSKVS